jgi:hypothetical protein
VAPTSNLRKQAEAIVADGRQALAAAPLAGMELAECNLSEELRAGLAWVGRRRCAARVRGSRRSVRVSARGWPRLVASAWWRRG